MFFLNIKTKILNFKTKIVTKMDFFNIKVKNLVNFELLTKISTLENQNFDQKLTFNFNL